MLMDTSWFDNIFTGDQEVDVQEHFDDLDINGDGDLTAADCPFNYGTYKAKMWWDNVMVPYIKSQVTEDMTSQYGDKVVGSYHGKPLVPGEMGAGQGDFDYLVDKLQITKGLSLNSAVRIAAKIKLGLYGA
jgi:hypothetical protein